MIDTSRKCLAPLLICASKLKRGRNSLPDDSRDQIARGGSHEDGRRQMAPGVADGEMTRADVEQDQPGVAGGERTIKTPRKDGAGEQEQRAGHEDRPEDARPPGFSEHADNTGIRPVAPARMRQTGRCRDRRNSANAAIGGGRCGDVETDARRTTVWDSNRGASNQPLENAGVARLRGPEVRAPNASSRNRTRATHQQRMGCSASSRLAGCSGRFPQLASGPRNAMKVVLDDFRPWLIRAARTADALSGLAQPSDLRPIAARPHRVPQVPLRLQR